MLIVLTELLPYWKAANELINVPEGLEKLTQKLVGPFRNEKEFEDTNPWSGADKHYIDPALILQKYLKWIQSPDSVASSPITRQADIDAKARKLECGGTCNPSEPAVWDNDWLAAHAVAKLTEKVGTPPGHAQCALIQVFQKISAEAVARRESLLNRAVNATLAVNTRENQTGTDMVNLQNRKKFFDRNEATTRAWMT